ncbi:L-aspartate oxidase [Metabacillus sp. 84]|uniref:L-aspartate oxidase n=1 Tax=unclassified Metabacillus TaxID=2675274 RepID=UPI003CF11C3D
MQQTDVLIVGSGIAALAVAYYICEGLNVTVVTKGKLHDGNSAMAQGGIAAALAEDDSWEFHLADTMQAGDGHTNPHAAEMLAKEGEKLIRDLISMGLPADRTSCGSLALGREGAHRINRIIHAGGDQTGRAAVGFLAEQTRSKVKILEGMMVSELLVKDGSCYGVRAVDLEGRQHSIYSSAVVLATGGCGALYSYTSNHKNSTGDGIALAYQAGAILSDLEFVQFHPTMLYRNGRTEGLISEAVRGEGAFLQDTSGRRLMKQAHPLADLAPRDVVAREIFRTIQKGEQVFLNIKPITGFQKRFPNISRMCTEQGVNLSEGLIPVMPGMHFAMGGVQTDLAGRTSIHRLYAAGEAACNGVHGANRLASNSLLEGIVFGKKIAEDLFLLPPLPSFPEKPARFTSVQTYPATKQEVAEMMDRFAGIERDGEGLTYLSGWFKKLKLEARDAGQLTHETMELANMITAGELIARAALERTESRGCHFRSDFPEKQTEWTRRKIKWQPNKKALEVNR